MTCSFSHVAKRAERSVGMTCKFMQSHVVGHDMPFTDVCEKTAVNTGATCAFMGSHKRVKAGEGYTQRKDVHLDRMAAYLVAMNGDPNKPEVAAAQAYFAMQTRRARPRSTSARGACLAIMAVKYPRLIPPVVPAV